MTRRSVCFSWAGLLTIGVSGLFLSGCGGESTGFSGDRRPFEGKWTRSEKVNGKAASFHSLNVVFDGNRFRIEDTLETTGNKSITIYDGAKVYVDGKPIDVEMDKPENTMEAFWMDRLGDKKSDGETVCGRTVEIYERRDGTGEVVNVRTYYVDKETGYTLRMKETVKLSNGRTTEKLIDCRSITYKDVSPDAFRTNP